MNEEMLGDFLEGENGYQTCDLYLAAFFQSIGAKMIKATRDQRTRRVYFIFEKNETMQGLRVNYFSREAKVDALTYADNIKSLKSLCHNITTGTAVPR